MSKTKKVFSIIGDVLFYLFLFFALMFSIMNLKVKNKGTDIPTLFGKGYLSVVSDSMDISKEQAEFKGFENTFEKNDVIIVNVFKNLEQKESYEFKVGDIVTFIDYDEDGNEFLNSHRIYEIEENGTYILKGDNPRYYGYNRINLSQIKAIYTGKIANLGSFYNFLTTKLGFFLCLILPILILLTIQIIKFVRNYIKYNNEKNKLNFEEEKEKIKKELLEELQKEKEKKE